MKPIHQVLAPLGIPVCHPPYTGTSPEFITFTLINNSYNDWSSGEAFSEETVYSVDLFTKLAYEDLADQIKTLLRAEKYVVQTGPEFYEADTKYHHLNFEARGWDDTGWQI